MSPPPRKDLVLPGSMHGHNHVPDQTASSCQGLMADTNQVGPRAARMTREGASSHTDTSGVRAELTALQGWLLGAGQGRGTECGFLQPLVGFRIMPFCSGSPGDAGIFRGPSAHRPSVEWAGSSGQPRWVLHEATRPLTQFLQGGARVQVTVDGVTEGPAQWPVQGQPQKGATHRAGAGIAPTHYPLQPRQGHPVPC